MVRALHAPDVIRDLSDEGKLVIEKFLAALSAVADGIVGGFDQQPIGVG